MDFEAGAGMGRGERVVQLRERTTFKAQHGHHAVLQALARHRGRLRHAHHFDRLGSKDETQSVGIVYRNVENHAAASLRAVDAPRLQMLRQIHRVEDTGEQHLAHRAGTNEVAHLSVGCSIAQVVIGAQRDAGFFTGAHGFKNVVAGNAERPAGAVGLQRRRKRVGNHARRGGRNGMGSHGVLLV